MYLNKREPVSELGFMDIVLGFCILHSLIHSNLRARPRDEWERLGGYNVPGALAWIGKKISAHHGWSRGSLQQMFS